MSAQPAIVRRALISVSDKSGLAELGRALAACNVEILSTGGSARALAEAGVPVTEVGDHTGFPEVMGGRVKTLHPKIHGGILARAGIDDEAASQHDMPPIDLVVVNLYPFAETVSRPDCGLAEAIENIDIGGPAMLRAAAKNHDRVGVACSPADYPQLIENLPAMPSIEQRRALAVKAFAHTAHYDGQISQWLSARAGDAPDHERQLPPVINLGLDRLETLRYGENPHQAAGLYLERGTTARGVAGADLVQGKPLSYNNLLDADAAWRGVCSFGEAPACAIVKHTNPCGAARADSALGAYRKAHACDPVSAFGGIIAFNRLVDAETAKAVIEQFCEVLIAPGVDAAAQQVLAARPNLRLMIPGPPLAGDFDLRRIDGGWLVQQSDQALAGRAGFEVVTERRPTDAEWHDLEFAWSVVAMVRSNAIVLVRDGATAGIGAGQMSRVDSARIATLKAADQRLDLNGAAMASDAFFPFADGVEAAAEAGVRSVIQPGGSRRDSEVIEAANRLGLAMVLTGRRHFRH
ncbi:MAG: bifunctional phosphoribosylaminoimidazolecarboxamide formyltransferase/IMP cyclohydrolase [Wenzhouxiangellaceae bacterium]|nr:bifunctional phosphoribosylaminoimidazolecarboxamide formyltransferase/IMP cyclohydrolase [Wenzhouxiangellaceae bacterium]